MKYSCWINCGRKECEIGRNEINQVFLIEEPWASRPKPEMALDWNFCPWCAMPNLDKFERFGIPDSAGQAFGKAVLTVVAQEKVVDMPPIVR